MTSEVNVAPYSSFENKSLGWTKWQKLTLVLIAILNSLAIGSSPIVYSFANSSIDNKTPVTTQGITERSSGTAHRGEATTANELGLSPFSTENGGVGATDPNSLEFLDQAQIGGQSMF